MKLIARTFTKLAVALVLFGGLAQAQTAYQEVQSTIPFEFTVGKRTFPAGNYTLLRSSSINPQMLTLRDSRGHNLAVFLTNPVESTTVPERPRLTFYVDGGRYRLAQVWQENNTVGHELYRGKAVVRIAATQVGTQSALARPQP
jgi:hypothetical protein